MSDDLRSAIETAFAGDAESGREAVMEVIARLDRGEVRRRNLIPASKMPYQKPIKARSGVTIQYDSGDYPAILEKALGAFGWDAVQRELRRRRAQGERIGAKTSSHSGRARGMSGAYKEMNESLKSFRKSDPASEFLMAEFIADDED